MAITKDPKEKIAAALELGVSGTNIFGGIIQEEYNPKLQGIQGIAIYDEMRKSDATVKAAVLATSLPIRRANWFMVPASEDEKDIEIGEFVSKAIFELMTITWDDFLRQALLSMPYGVMVFEKVFTIAEVDGSQMVIWKKFAPRLPTSIKYWTAGGNDGITQTSLTGGDILLPMEKLLIFVNEMEGENWWGTSILRAAYKPWYIKTNLEKIDAIAIERQGIGIPYITMPTGATDEDISKAETILKNMHANEKQWLLEPKDMPVEFKDMQSGKTKDATKSIAYNNRQITLAVLAQFLDLGSGATGSRALSVDQTDLFLQSLEAVANNIADGINTHAIKQLVDMNYDNVKEYPKIDFTNVSRTDVDKLSVAYQRLSQSGGITPQESDENYLRNILGLPEIDEEEKKQKDIEDKEAKKEADDMNMGEIISKKKIFKSEIESALLKHFEKMSMAEQIDFIKDKLSSTKNIKKYKTFFNETREVLTERLTSLQRLIFKDNNDFKAWRELTFAEKKVNWQSIQNFMDNNEKSMNTETRKILNKAKDDYTKRMATAINSGDTKKVKTLKLKFKNDYISAVKKYMKDAYIFGKNNVAREMGVSAPANKKEIMASIDIAADSIAARHAEDLVTSAKLALVDQLEQGNSAAQAIGKVDAVLAQKILTLTRDTSSIVSAGHVNLGRKTVFDKYQNKIYALQRSEILDSKTCNFCLSMDGRIIEKTDPLAKIGTFHSHCRGIWVEILEDEEDKPTISGVPNSIRDRIGDTTNELIQPKKPIVKKNSAAKKKIDKGQAGQ